MDSIQSSKELCLLVFLFFFFSSLRVCRREVEENLIIEMAETKESEGKSSWFVYVSVQYYSAWSLNLGNWGGRGGEEVLFLCKSNFGM